MSVEEANKRAKSNLDLLLTLQIREISAKTNTLAIPAEYKDFVYLFKKEDNNYALPKHQLQDYLISLQTNKQPKKQAI